MDNKIQKPTKSQPKRQTPFFHRLVFGIISEMEFSLVAC